MNAFIRIDFLSPISTYPLLNKAVPSIINVLRHLRTIHNSYISFQQSLGSISGAQSSSIGTIGLIQNLLTPYRFQEQ